MLIKHLLHSLAKNFLHFVDMSNYVFVDHVSQNLVGTDAAHIMGLECCAPAEWVLSEEVLNLFSHSDSSQGEERPGQAFCCSEYVRDDPWNTLEAEHGSGSSHANHDLVCNHEDIVFIAESSDSLNDSMRVYKHPT